MIAAGSQPPSELSLVQLGHLDIDPAALAGEGGSLWELVGTDRKLDIRTPQNQLDRLPARGWRRVHFREADPNFNLGPAEMLAAPHAEAPDTWAVVNLAERDGTWLLSSDPGPLPVYPGRANRREPLRLTWPAGLRAPANTVPELTVVLTNVSSSPWINEHADPGYIRAWLLDDKGHRLEKSPFFASSSSDSDTLPDLDPGQSTSLPTHLATPDIDTYPAGDYTLDAMLTALSLNCQPGTLTLV